MDKSDPTWVSQTRRTKHNLVPLKHCSNAVSHGQLVKALKCSTDEVPSTHPYRDTRKVPLALPAVRTHSTMSPPYPYPGAPVTGRGQNNHHESLEQHQKIQHSLYQRKRALYTRQHEEWALPIYGNFSQRENFMKDMRYFLKSQMDEKNYKKRVEFKKAIDHTKVAYNETRDAIEKESQAKITHTLNQRLYRDENKKMMEEKQALRRSLQQREIEQERTLVKLDPINWSRTLR